MTDDTRRFRCRCPEGCGHTALPTPKPLVKQPAPIPNDREAIADLVIVDHHDRKAHGINVYGTPCQPFNGRNALQDAYEEVLDLSIYLKQAIVEKEESRDLHAKVQHMQALARDYLENYRQDMPVFHLAAGILAIAEHAIAGETAATP